MKDVESRVFKLFSPYFICSITHALKCDIIYVLSIIIIINFQFLTCLTKNMPKILEYDLVMHKSTVFNDRHIQFQIISDFYG